MHKKDGIITRMAKKNKEQTAEIPVDQPTSSKEPKSKKKREKAKDNRPHYFRAVLLGLLIVLIAALISGSLGYFSGIKQRKAEEENQRLTLAATHYQYGMQAMMSGNYEVARIQFEYVIQVYPDFPDIMEKYSEVLMNLAKTQQATSQPSATPTRDIQGAEALFQQAQTDITNQDWCTAVDTIKNLRDEDYTYETLTVDGMLWTSLRNCAVKKISTDGDLEGGLYYLTLAQKFAPLDHDAVNLAAGARLYVTGASYWEVDWSQVVHYFSQVYNSYPYMHDASGWTGIERYRIGLREYGKQLMASGDYCPAQEQFQIAFNIQSDDEISNLLNEATLYCQGPTAAPVTPTAEAAVPITIDTPIEPTLEIPTTEAPIEPTS